MTSIVAFSGSTRAASFHSRIVRALADLAPDGVTVAGHDLSAVPFYNQDLEGDAQPESVAALRAAVAAADGVIFAAPEYNYSYSALTKNTLDWITRPMGGGVLRDKKVMVICATPGPGGARRVSATLAEILPVLGNEVVAVVNVATVHEKLSATSDEVTDAALVEELKAGLAAF